MARAVFDVDTLQEYVQGSDGSEVIKAKDARLLAKASAYLAEYQRFSFSAITQYEITRGYHATNAVRQLAEYLQLVQGSDVIPISTAILDQASRLWAQARNGGHPRNDADLIIAATATQARLVLITGNVTHFDWIPTLPIENWRTT